jgi:hypothetical protein
MKTIARIEMINTTRPGISLFDSVSAASARASGKRHPSELKRILPARRLRYGVGRGCFSCHDGKHYGRAVFSGDDAQSCGRCHNLKGDIKVFRVRG